MTGTTTTHHPAPETMRAVVVTRPGGLDALEVRDVPTPAREPGWVLIAVRAFGVNESEVTTRKGGVRRPRHLPPHPRDRGRRGGRRRRPGQRPASRPAGGHHDGRHGSLLRRVLRRVRRRSALRRRPSIHLADIRARRTGQRARAGALLTRARPAGRRFGTGALTAAPRRRAPRSRSALEAFALVRGPIGPRAGEGWCWPRVASGAIRRPLLAPLRIRVGHTRSVEASRHEAGSWRRCTRSPASP
jgi:hypothetical protein